MSSFSDWSGINLDTTTGTYDVNPGAILGNFLGGPTGAATLGNLFGLLKPPQAPDLKGPDAISKAPTPADASTTKLQNELAQEKVAFSTSSYLNGGQGLLDEPTTTSRVLLGN